MGGKKFVFLKNFVEKRTETVKAKTKETDLKSARERSVGKLCHFVARRSNVFLSLMLPRPGFSGCLGNLYTDITGSDLAGSLNGY